MSYMGLAAVLGMTNKNIEFAGLRVKKGGEFSQSNETILLQTKLVYCLGQFLEAQIKAKNKDDFGGDDDDYGMYGDEDDYGEDDFGGDAIKQAIKASKQAGFDEDCFDDEPEADEKGVNEDSVLLSGIVLEKDGMTTREAMADMVRATLR